MFGTFSKRTMRSVLLGLTFALAAATSGAQSNPQLTGAIDYYSTPDKTTQVGRELVYCDGTKVMAWGVKTLHWEADIFEFCSNF